MAFTDVLFLIRHLHVKALPASLLPLCLAAPLYCDDLILDYQVYLIHEEDSFSDLIFNAAPYRLFATGHARIRIELTPQFRSASLTACKTRQSNAKANRPVQAEAPQEASPLTSLSKALITGLTFLTSLATQQPDSDSEDYDAEAHGFSDLNKEKAELPVPESDQLEWFSTLYSFFHKAPAQSYWMQHETELRIKDTWQLIEKQLNITESNGRSIRRIHMPDKSSRQQPPTGASLNFGSGWRPLIDVVEAGTGSMAELAGASLRGYEYYLPQETKKNRTLPVYGLAGLYQLSLQGSTTSKIYGWYPELLPTQLSSFSLYSISAMGKAQSLGLQELFKGVNTPFTGEFSLSQTNCFMYFHAYSKPSIHWHTLVLHEGSHRLVMIQTARHTLPDLVPAEEDICLISPEDMDDSAPAKQKIPRQ